MMNRGVSVICLPIWIGKIFKQELSQCVLAVIGCLVKRSFSQVIREIGIGTVFEKKARCF
jgi:hypothetical protein